MKEATVFLSAMLLAISPAIGEGQGARESREIDGIRIEFPVEEADLIEVLEPVLEGFHKERRAAVAEEAEALASVYSQEELREKVQQRVAQLCAREKTSESFAARYDAHREKFEDFAAAWERWSGTLGEVYLWNRSGLEEFQVDGPALAFKFPQVSFSDNGSKFGLNVPMIKHLVALDAWDEIDPEQVPHLRIDLPLVYRPGTPVENILAPGIEFLEGLPAFLRKQAASIVGEHLGEWLIEYLLLGEMRAEFFDEETVRDSVLPAALARYLLFIHLAKKDGGEKTMARSPLMFAFVAADGRSPVDAEMVAALMELDPLGKIPEGEAAKRQGARNLITMALVDLTQKGGGMPIFHRFKEEGIAVPEGGFDAASFAAGLDQLHGGEGALASAIADRKEVLRTSFETARAAKEGAGKAPDPASGAEPGAEQGPVPGRNSEKFGTITITYPDELAEEVRLLGPEYAELFKAGHEGVKEFAETIEPREPLEVRQEDIDAFGRYGLVADEGVMRGFAAQASYLSNMKSAMVTMLQSDRIQIWFKDDLRELLKAGRKFPDFTYDAETDKVNFNYSWGLDSELGEGVSSAEEFKEKIAAIDPPNWPIILDRAEYEEGAPVASDSSFVEHIRERSEDILAALGAAAEGELGDEEAVGLKMFDLLDEKQVWFTVAHEAAELAILKTVVASSDRRWFCDGLSNWIAIREVDRRFGPGAGEEAFRAMYDPEDLDPLAAEVDLLKWPTAEDVDSGRAPEVNSSPAHYYFATLVIEEALANQDEGFVKDWLTEIRKTRWNRASSRTVLAAYKRLSSRDLEAIISEVVK